MNANSKNSKARRSSSSRRNWRIRATGIWLLVLALSPFALSSCGTRVRPVLVGESDLIEIVPAHQHPVVGTFPKEYDAAVMSVKMYDKLSKGTR